MSKNIDYKFIFGLLLAFISLWVLMLLLSDSRVKALDNTESALKADFAVIEGSLVSSYNSDYLRYTAIREDFEVWLDKLEEMENCPVKGIVDSNGLRSYGRLCFQQATYLWAMKRFSYICMPNAEEGEWLNNLSDTRTQRCLAKQFFLNDKNASRHWYTSIYKRGLSEPPL